jgi:diguanylate cyclase (GGDEF)-like protein
MILDSRSEVAPQAYAHHQAMAVPGLPDRATFLQRLDVAISLAERQHSSFAVLLLDVGLSADEGLLDLDRLNLAASAIRSTARLTDTLAFLSGSEFALLLSVGNEDGAVRVAGKIILALDDALGTASRTETSIGISMFAAHGRTAEPLLRAAEGALYQARRGHQGVILAVKVETSPEQLEAELEQRFGAAIAQDEFVLHYQPIVNLQSGLPVSVEALVRWNHPELGLLAPGEFLHLAEKDGTLVALSLRIVDAALAHLRGWRDQGLVLSMSLNVAISMLEREGADQIVLGCLHGLSLPPDCLTLELRDEGLLDLSSTVLKNLFGLASAGICLSIDDFGHGTGSLQVLRDLPVQEIKLEGDFVAQVYRSEADATIIGALIALGRKLGKCVVAKGIESDEVRQKLCELGCEYGQGFHFAQALDAKALQSWCANRIGGVA